MLPDMGEWPEKVIKVTFTGISGRRFDPPY
jgi:hypothetical protein